MVVYITLRRTSQPAETHSHTKSKKSSERINSHIMIPKSADLAEFTQMYQLKPSSFSTSRRFCPFEGHGPPHTPTLLLSNFCFPFCHLSLMFPEQIQTTSSHIPLCFPTGLLPPKHLPTTFPGVPTVELNLSLLPKKKVNVLATQDKAVCSRSTDVRLKLVKSEPESASGKKAFIC